MNGWNLGASLWQVQLRQRVYVLGPKGLGKNGACAELRPLLAAGTRRELSGKLRHGEREEATGRQDWDLIPRTTELLPAGS